ncbi:MAG: ribonuclease H-like domain-containing protein [Halococcoides sp.]
MRVEESFIPVYGVGETTEKRLWRRGITHWDDFEPSAVGSTTADRIQSFIDDARESLDARDSDYFAEQFPSRERWRLYETFADRAAFLDIETTGLDHHRHNVTTVSVRLDGETTTLVRDRDLTARRLREVLDDADLLVTFNGARFDVPFLKTAFDCDAVLDRAHLDLMYPCRRLDLTGGLKQIERDLGIERDRPDLGGDDAVRLWREYRRGDEHALETLVSYNREDVDHLETVADRVVDRLHARTVPDDCPLSVQSR